MSLPNVFIIGAAKSGNAPLPPDLRRDLGRLYAPHNAALARLVGRELPAAWMDESGPTSGGAMGR